MDDDISSVRAGGTASDRAERLTRTIRDQSFPNVRPRDSATLILIDRAHKVPKVLLGRRHARHRFLPGKFVFPGGRIEPADRLMAVSAHLHQTHAERLMRRVKRPSLAKSAAYALTAVRETYEETGIMLGVPATKAMAAPPGLWQEFAKAGIVPDLSQIHFIARAITPPGRPLPFRQPLLCRRRIGHRPARRGLHRTGEGACGTRLAAPERGAAARYAGHYGGRVGRTAGPHRVRHEPRPSGAALPHAAQAFCAGSAVKTPYLRLSLTFGGR